jgi:CHAT domain-containing protein
LLLQEDRIIEAQRILDLLKVQELDDYLQDVQRSPQTETGVTFWQPEAQILALYDEVLLAGTELTQLQSRNPNSLSPNEQDRLTELTAQQNQLYTSFIDWLEHPEIIDSLDQLRADTRSRTVDIENFTDLQDQLAQLPQPTVILYPLILENRLELVLVSADAPPVRYPVAVDALTLNRTIVEFGQALKQPGSAVQLPAQQLYDWVIAPLEADLAALGTESIIFAPDGALRYVPLSALHDGDQWLVERFTFSQITAASETDFAETPSDRRDLLAAACATCTFNVAVGDDTFAFQDLPATRQEVNALAAQIPDTAVLVDEDFTPEQFVERLGSYNLIHLATHGLFISGDPDASFLLFGDGQTVNLRQIRREWQQLDADLIVLSACETALGSAELGDGIEVLGLGFQLQRVGAKAVMASLWQVSDRGTQILMNAFYDALGQGMTKAAALQVAQRSLINSGEGPSETGARGIGVVGPQRNASVERLALQTTATPTTGHRSF